MLTGFENNKDFKSILDLINIKNFDEAENRLEHLKKNYLNNFFLENLHGSIFASRGDFEEAKKKFEEVSRSFLSSFCIFYMRNKHILKKVIVKEVKTDLIFMVKFCLKNLQER